MVQGFKNEENARQLVQKELADMKDESKNLQMGSDSTVCSEASIGAGLEFGTFARPPPLTSRWNEIFIPRKMEIKSWVTDHSEGNLQAITDDEVAKLQQANKWIDWDQTKKEQGTWPRNIMVNMWLKHETNLVTMIDLLKITRGELDKAAYKINGQHVKAKLEVSPLRRPKGRCIVLQRTQRNERW